MPHRCFQVLLSYEAIIIFSIDPGKQNEKGREHDHSRDTRETDHSTHPLGHSVSDTSSTGTTSFGDRAEDNEKYLTTAADWAAIVVVRPRTMVQ